MENHQDFFKTKNLFVATFLMASRKVVFEGLQTLDQKTKLFCFSPKEKAEKLEIAYFRGGKLSVKTVFSEYNGLKDLLFQRTTNGEINYGKNTGSV